MFYNDKLLSPLYFFQFFPKKTFQQNHFFQLYLTIQQSNHLTIQPSDICSFIILYFISVLVFTCLFKLQFTPMKQNKQSITLAEWTHTKINLFPLKSFL